MAKHSRRKLILHPLQIKLIITLEGIVIGISVILVASLFFLIRNNPIFLSMPEAQVQLLLSEAIWPVVIIAIVLFIVTAWAVILISQKIYGPLYRLSAYIKKLSEGEVTEEFEFRRGDAFDGLKDLYNDFRKSFEKTLTYDYQEMARIFTELQQVLDELYNKEIDRQLYNQLQSACDRLAKALDITSEVIEKDK